MSIKELRKIRPKPNWKIDRNFSIKVFLSSRTMFRFKNKQGSKRRELNAITKVSCNSKYSAFSN
jgi:hypothetical protein